MLNLEQLKKTERKPFPKSAAKFRLQEDFKEFGPTDNGYGINFPDPDNLMEFEFTLVPPIGIYMNAAIHFTVNVPESYPHEPPKVKCVTPIFHPNIDDEGNICLNILREDWRPVLSIRSVILGLQYLLIEPRPEDALNQNAADMLNKNPSLFKKCVYNLLQQNGAFSQNSE